MNARPFVSHAPGYAGRGLCGTLIRRGHPVETGFRPMCNRCQRAIWLAENKAKIDERRKARERRAKKRADDRRNGVKRKPISVAQTYIAPTRAQRSEAHQAKMHRKHPRAA